MQSSTLIHELKTQVNKQARVIRIQFWIITALVFLLGFLLVRNYKISCSDTAKPIAAEAQSEDFVISAGNVENTVTTFMPAASAAPLTNGVVTEEDFEGVEHAVCYGEFTLTAYCPCYECCGKTEDDPFYKVTASGAIAEAQRTIAVDPSVIPLGSRVYINDVEYYAEDTGGLITGNRIDIYFESHEEALEFGVQSALVYVIE